MGKFRPGGLAFLPEYLVRSLWEGFVAGIEELQVLLARLEPILHGGEFVFCSVGDFNWAKWMGLDPVGMFREVEGLSLILRRDRADLAGLEYESVFRLIGLTVHSSLDAVGLTAAIANCLAARGLSANVVAAYYHDHIFVPADRSADAMQAIQSLASRSSEF